MDKMDDFFKHIEGIVEYWAETGKDKEQAADGVAFSILTMIDGVSTFKHKLDLLIDGESVYEMVGMNELHSDVRYHHVKPKIKKCEEVINDRDNK